jgi:tocopherol O-methyltransferase
VQIDDGREITDSRAPFPTDVRAAPIALRPMNNSMSSRSMTETSSLRELPHAVSVDTVGAYYNRMMRKLLHKYGPGPRVHYHMGYYPEGRCPQHPQGTPSEVIRDSIWASQERLLEITADIWDASKLLSGSVLDVGCGLGGAALWWAKRFGAEVTCVTVAEDHPEVIRDLARRAGVGDQIRVILSEASDVPVDRQYDSVVAIESADYFDRNTWFARLAQLVRPGGFVCIEDVFRMTRRGAITWSDYFYARPGSIGEFERSAASAGFTLIEKVDITSKTAPFWMESRLWTQAILNEPGSENIDSEERRRLRISYAVHRELFEEWNSSEMCEAVLLFKKTV